MDFMAFRLCVKMIRHGFSLVILVSDEVSRSRNDWKEKYLLVRKGSNSRVRISKDYLQWALTLFQRNHRNSASMTQISIASCSDASRAGSSGSSS